MRIVSILLLLLATGASAQQAADALAPEVATGIGAAEVSPRVAKALEAKTAGVPAEAQDWMVIAAHPLAAEAGADVLAAGGSAADAMVAVQATLGLVEPQSSGLGGGAFLVWWDAATETLTTLDGRETAPLAARPELFLNAEGQTLDFFDAVVGGRSVGTPGTPRLMEEAHRRWGRQPWPGLFASATRLAEDGFPVSPRMAESIAADAERLAVHPATAAYFLPGGTPLAAGATLTNPAYAETLKAVAAQGADAIYTGPIARAIVAAVQGAEANPGLLSELDLALYRVVEREPVCVTYRAHEVCGMGPPSSGALTIGQILGLLRGTDLAALGPDSAEAWRRIGEASRLAFADRGRYMADIDFVPMPLKGLTDDAYLAGRAALIETGTALETVEAGEPEWDHAGLYGDSWSPERPSTSQVTIVDRYGNVLSMTTTIENGFGSRLMAAGFLLNNELTDFSFATQEDGRPVANRVEPGKRPRSSMAPTVVLKDGRPVLAIGSPGGSAIIGYVAQAVIAWVDWGMDVQQAVAMGHALNRFGTFELEADSAAEALGPELEALGFEVRIGSQTSGLAAIEIGATLKGGADPRREGVALGE